MGVSELDRLGTLPRNVLERYRGDWALICPAHRDPVALRPEVARMMECGLPGQPEADGWARVMREGTRPKACAMPRKPALPAVKPLSASNAITRMAMAAWIF